MMKEVVISNIQYRFISRTLTTFLAYFPKAGLCDLPVGESMYPPTQHF
jgi:hypothetical protein